MIKNIINYIAGVFVLIALFVLLGAVYTIDETQQVVITQFGQPIGDPVTTSGLHLKVPFIQVANYFEKRVLQWDGDPNQIPTRDKRYIWVDTTARWKIVDALQFMKTVRTEETAQGRLDFIINGDARDVVAENILPEIVRNSNRLIDEKDKIDAIEIDPDVGKTVLEKIEKGREALSREILKRSSMQVPKYGVELVDVRIKRINYIKEVQDKVYERMISERRRAAERYRSEGQGKKAEIEGQMVKELEKIQSEAYKQAQTIKGEADAKAIKIYADAYNKDPEFYSFIKTLDSYRKTVNEDTTLMLSTDNEFYSQIKGINAQ